MGHPVVAQVQTVQCAAAPYPANAFQLQVVQAQPLQEEATVKMQVGVWSVCEDQQGEFYHNGTTGQTFDSPPPELLGLLQQLQGGAPVVSHAASVYQPQAAPVYQSPVAQEAPVYYKPAVAPAAPVYQSPIAQGAPMYHTAAVAQGSPVYHMAASATATLLYQGASSVQSSSFKSPAISQTTPVYQSSVAQHAAPNVMSLPQYVSQGHSQVGYQHP